MSIFDSYTSYVQIFVSDDNLRKYQWVFTKLGMYIDIVGIWIAIANGQISSIFDRVICPSHDSGGVFFHDFISSVFLLYVFHYDVSQMK